MGETKKNDWQKKFTRKWREKDIASKRRWKKSREEKWRQDSPSKKVKQIIRLNPPSFFISRVSSSLVFFTFALSRTLFLSHPLYLSLPSSLYLLPSFSLYLSPPFSISSFSLSLFLISLFLSPSRFLSLSLCLSPEDIKDLHHHR